MTKEYREIEYALVQGIDQNIWEWSASVAGVVIKGQEATKAGAIAAAEKAIDRALGIRKDRLVRPVGRERRQ